MTRPSWKIMPMTALGKWSVGLSIAMPVLFLIGGSFRNLLYESLPSGDTILADMAARPALALTMLAGMGVGVAAFVTGLLALIRQGERAVLAYASTIVGALFILFLAAELLSPH